MATANFYTRNAQSYYAFRDTYQYENEDGTTEDVMRDEMDWDILMDDIRFNAEKLFPITSNAWNNRMDARELCETETTWQDFGNGNAWTLQTAIDSVIVIRSGYYGGAVLDYDIKVNTQGSSFYLSEYNDVDELIEDYLNELEDLVDWHGINHKWNSGTFKMQKNNIRKWIEKLIEKEIEKCEKFCKDNCDDELCVSARFGNGETWYSKVG